MPPGVKRTLFSMFLASGFCGLLYQIVWIRLALSSFGVITPVVSVVVSVFMLGLSLGSWLGGRWIAPLSRRSGWSAIAFYAIAEGVIALGAFAIPGLFATARELLLPIGGMDSGPYLLFSGLLILASLLPWCFCMGATYPVVMEYIRELDRREETSFSYLYLANVLGATLGAVLTSFALIELLGFTGSLRVAGLTNAAIAAAAFWLWRRQPRRSASDGPSVAERAGLQVEELDTPPREPALGRGLTCVVLFTTGFAAMALEIVWMRAFTPVLGTLVYAFAGLLTVYLVATWSGSLLYRSMQRRGRAWSAPVLVAGVALSALLPNLASDPRIIVACNRALLFTGVPTFAVPLALASIFPFCALLGYLTPKLIDEDSRGGPERAGLAYGINIIGSILGPLAAAYLLLPWLGSRLSMLLLASPFLLLFPAVVRASGHPLRPSRIAVPLAAGVATIAISGIGGISYEEGSHIRDAEVRRDHTATVISYGAGLRSQLIVNGHGMTTLSALTKVMAHLPLVSLDHEPRRALVIAFGMGTTYRSLLTWDIDVTAVELVPSVIDAFDYYFEDADKALRNPHGQIVIDDGRRFLARTDQLFDLITIDPPPPVEAAGSSLLYAEEFYVLAKRRLAPGGIVHQWFPNGSRVEPAIRQAVLRSALNSFEHVRVFQSVHGAGLHILCSSSPIDVPDADEFAARLPRAASRDLLEWAPPGTSLEWFVSERILAREVDVEELVAEDSSRSITDDRPLNEYFVLRRFADL